MTNSSFLIPIFMTDELDMNLYLLFIPCAENASFMVSTYYQKAVQKDFPRDRSQQNFLRKLMKPRSRHLTALMNLKTITRKVKV